MPPRAESATLDHVDVWIFDLDNTLYPASCDLFEQVRVRIGGFIAERSAWTSMRPAPCSASTSWITAPPCAA